MSSGSARRFSLIALVGALLLVLVGCTQLLGAPATATSAPSPTSGVTQVATPVVQAVAATPTPTAVPATPTPVPTAIPTATQTPVPTATSSPTPSPTPTATPVPPTPTPSPTPAPDKITSVLLLGYRGSGLSGGTNLSDAIQLVVYNQTKKTAVIISVPRDIWVTSAVSGSRTGKINTFMAYGGGKSAKAVISKVLGYQIPNYIAVDFNNFRRAIDAVGGIDVNVVRSFGHFRAGTQHFNGTRALEYTRIRKSTVPAEGSDFARQRRQRQVIEAFLAKVRRPAELVHLPALLRLAQTGFRTDLSLPSAANLSTLVTDSEGVKFYEFGFTSSGYLRSTTSPGGLYIIVPRSRTGTWSQVRGFVNTFISNPPLGQAMTSHLVRIVNATGGKASNSTLSNYVEGLGYRIGSIGSGQARDTSAVVVSQGDKVIGDGLKSSLDKKGISANLQVSGASSPTVYFGRDYR